MPGPRAKREEEPKPLPDFLAIEVVDGATLALHHYRVSHPARFFEELCLAIVGVTLGTVVPCQV
jgi:hypothetical protein